ncbi:hypothetical protein DFH11DRAFT_1708326 [Phellopilus nigrolimitatus]|nr:hypothetical protein DFH11DRAFT_1708326 [Phellopilus nigrolimitatus]
MSGTGKSALLIGATGAVGKHVLRELLASSEFVRVGEAGRRVTPLEQLGADVGAKLEQRTINFEKLEEAGLKEGRWDVVFITLGTTRAAAGSAAAFEKIDREYVVNSARAAKTDDPDHKQSLVYCSSTSANANSHLLYVKSKGLTENALAGLGYSDTIIFRPGYLANAERPSTRFGEALAGPLVKLASYVSSSLQIDVSTLAKSFTRAGHLGSARLPPVAEASESRTPDGAPFTLIGNRGAEQLAKAAL